MKLPPPCEPGRVLGHFTIGRSLGDVVGASLAAFHAVDRTGQPVVVVVAPPRPASAHADFGAMLEGLKSFEHKSAPRVLCGAMEDDLAWVALDAALFAEAETLEASVLRKASGLAVVPTLLLMLDVCRVLRAAAQAGVHHGRLGLKSVLVAGVLLSAVLELGLAALLGVERAKFETAYAAPETLDCNVCSMASDVYAFGVVLHCALAGSLDPFSDGDATQDQDHARMMLAARGQSPRKLAGRVAGVPSSVDDFVAACTAKSAHRRLDWPAVERRLEAVLSDAVRLARDSEGTAVMPASIRARQLAAPSKAAEELAQPIEEPQVVEEPPQAAHVEEHPQAVEELARRTEPPPLARVVEPSAASAEPRDTLRIFVGGLLVVTGGLTVAVVTLALLGSTNAAAPSPAPAQTTAPPEPPAVVVPASAVTVTVQPLPPAPTSSADPAARTPAPYDGSSARSRARTKQLYYWRKSEER